MNYKSTRIGLLSTVLIALPISAQGGEQSNKDWQYGVSAGVFYTPTFLGDDDYQFSALPNITASYGDTFSASLAGVEYLAYESGRFRMGPVLRYDFGRDEDGSNPLALGDDSDDLMGLGDVDGTVEIGSFVQYEVGNLSATLEIRHGINGHEGLVGDIEVKYSDSVEAFGKTLTYSLGPQTSFASDNFNSAFFDISSAQSGASGISEYDADGGFNTIGLRATVIADIDDQISIIGFAGYDRLVGDIADSSLVRERGSENQGTFGISLNYAF